MREYFCENILLFVWIKFRYKILRKMGLAYWTGCFILLFWMYFEWIVKSGQLLNKYVWYVALMISLRINLEDEKNKQTANHNHQIDSCIIFFQLLGNTSFFIRNLNSLLWIVLFCICNTSYWFWSLYSLHLRIHTICIYANEIRNYYQSISMSVCHLWTKTDIHIDRLTIREGERQPDLIV